MMRTMNSISVTLCGRAITPSCPFLDHRMIWSGMRKPDPHFGFQLWPADEDLLCVSPGQPLPSGLEWQPFFARSGAILDLALEGTTAIPGGRDPCGSVSISTRSTR